MKVGGTHFTIKHGFCAAISCTVTVLPLIKNQCVNGKGRKYFALDVFLLKHR
jgi:hypothetical protein